MKPRDSWIDETGRRRIGPSLIDVDAERGLGLMGVVRL